MKKLFLLLLMLFCYLLTLSAEDCYVVSKFDGYVLDDNRELVRRTIELQCYPGRHTFFGEGGEYCMFFYSGSARYWFTFSSLEVEKLRSNLQKVQEWSKLAKEKKLSITKELPNSNIYVLGKMRVGNRWYSSISYTPLSFNFLSEIENDKETIGISIIGGTVVSSENEFVDIKFENIAFLNEQIDLFINAISSKTVESAREKYEKQKKDSDIFN